jgi:Tol biopolymer transport system component
LKSALPSLRLFVAATGLSLLSACPVAVVPSASLYKENPLTLGFPLTFEAQWSPDGKSIALLGMPVQAERYNTPQIYFIDAQSLQLKQSWKIHNPAQISRDWNAPASLSWSPDSSRIHFFQSGGNPRTVDRLFLHSLTPGSSQIETRMWNLPIKFNNLNFIGFSGPVLAPDQRSVALLEKKSATDPEIEKWLKDNSDTAQYTELYALKTYNLDTETLSLNHPVFKSVDYEQIYPFWGPDLDSIYLPHATYFNASESQPDRPSQLWSVSEVKGT